MVEDGLKHYGTCAPPVVELIYMIEKHITLINKNCGTYFLFLDFAFKFCNTDCVMPSFGKQFIFVEFKIGCFKVNYPVKL